MLFDDDFFSWVVWCPCVFNLLTIDDGEAEFSIQINFIDVDCFLVIRTQISGFIYFLNLLSEWFLILLGNVCLREIIWSLFLFLLFNSFFWNIIWSFPRSSLIIFQSPQILIEFVILFLIIGNEWFYLYNTSNELLRIFASNVVCSIFRFIPLFIYKVILFNLL